MIVTGLILLLLALLGTPLFAVIALGALWGFHQEELDLAGIVVEINRLSEMPVLVAIPLFTFAGYLLGESGAPKRLMRISDALLGWLPGGLAIVCLAACALFTAFTGASGVTIVALGALLYPALREAGYPENFSLGLITTSGSLGLLFAPSLPLILYGVVAQQLVPDANVGIDDLFLAGILPGLLMLTVLAGYAMLKGGRVSRRTGVSLLSALRESALELPLPFVVLGGIYSGFFAVSEAAVVTAIYVFVVVVILRREVKLGELVAVVRESMVLVGAILLILGVSLASTNLMIDRDVPTLLFEQARAFIDGPHSFLIALLVFLLLLGMLLDIFSALVIVTPIILPMALRFDVDPIHLGIVFLAAMQIGYFTPPVGMNLFIASFRFGKPVMTLYRATIPFFLLLLASVIVIAFWPALSLVLLDR